MTRWRKIRRHLPGGDEQTTTFHGEKNADLSALPDPKTASGGGLAGSGAGNDPSAVRHVQKHTCASLFCGRLRFNRVNYSGTGVHNEMLTVGVGLIRSWFGKHTCQEADGLNAGVNERR